MPHVTPLHAADPRRVGRYRLAGRIAGMPASGQVYLATTISGSEVTITLLGDEEAADGAARDRFAAEAEAARRVAPFCAASILDAGVDGGHAFLVSEYVAGPSLLELIRAEGSRHGAELAALAIGAATGLAAIHQAGLAHGDFGPEHLVLSTAGPRVVAFGITGPHAAATPAAATPAADMLAWAQTMVFAASGSPPGSPEDLQVLPQPLRRLAAKCLSADPAARPAARSVVLELLGEDEPPAGVLAEGSRRAARASASTARAPASTARTLASTARAPVSTAPASTAAGPGMAPAANGQQLPRPTRRRVSAFWWTAGALVAALAVVALIYYAVGAGGQTGARGPESSGGTDRTTAASSPTASSPTARPGTPSATATQPPPTPTVAPTLAGAWSGQATQSNVASAFSVRVDLGAGGRSGTISYSGTIAYSGTAFTCSGDLSLVSSADRMNTMDQTIVIGQAICANGVVTLRQQASGDVLFRFHGQGGEDARGTLAKG